MCGLKSKYLDLVIHRVLRSILVVRLVWNAAFFKKKEKCFFFVFLIIMFVIVSFLKESISLEVFAPCREIFAIAQGDQA